MDAPDLFMSSEKESNLSTGTFEPASRETKPLPSLVANRRESVDFFSERLPLGQNFCEKPHSSPIEKFLGLRNLPRDREARLLKQIAFWTKVGALSAFISSLCFVVSHELLYHHSDQATDNYCDETPDSWVHILILLFQIGVSITTVFVLMSITHYWKYRHTIDMIFGVKSPRAGWWGSAASRVAIFEFCASVIHCPPGLRGLYLSAPFAFL